MEDSEFKKTLEKLCLPPVEKSMSDVLRRKTLEPQEKKKKKRARLDTVMIKLGRAQDDLAAAKAVKTLYGDMVNFLKERDASCREEWLDYVRQGPILPGPYPHVNLELNRLNIPRDEHMYSEYMMYWEVVFLAMLSYLYSHGHWELDAVEEYVQSVQLSMSIRRAIRSDSLEDDQGFGMLEELYSQYLDVKSHMIGEMLDKEFSKGVVVGNGETWELLYELFGSEFTNRGEFVIDYSKVPCIRADGKTGYIREDRLGSNAFFLSEALRNQEEKVEQIETYTCKGNSHGYFLFPNTEFTEHSGLTCKTVGLPNGFRVIYLRPGAVKEYYDKHRYVNPLEINKLFVVMDFDGSQAGVLENGVENGD